MSLPHSYNSLVSTLSSASHLTKTKITADSSKAFLLDEYKHHLLREEEDTKLSKDRKAGKDSKHKAFAMDSKKKDKHKHKVDCHNCHKKGHMKADCWSKGSSKKGQGLRQ